MHYLEPRRRGSFFAGELKEVLLSEQLQLDEIQFILYNDTALEKLRLRGVETLWGAVVRIHTVRPRLSKQDFADPEQTTHYVRYRIIVSE